MMMMMIPEHVCLRTGWWTTDVGMYRSDFDISCPGSLEPVYVYPEKADRVSHTVPKTLPTHILSLKLSQQLL